VLALVPAHQTAKRTFTSASASAITFAGTRVGTIMAHRIARDVGVDNGRMVDVETREAKHPGALHFMVWGNVSLIAMANGLVTMTLLAAPATTASARVKTAAVVHTIAPLDAPNLQATRIEDPATIPELSALSTEAGWCRGW